MNLVLRAEEAGATWTRRLHSSPGSTPGLRGAKYQVRRTAVECRHGRRHHRRGLGRGQPRRARRRPRLPQDPLAAGRDGVRHQRDRAAGRDRDRPPRHERQQEVYFLHAGRIEIEFGDGATQLLEPGGIARVDAATRAPHAQRRRHRRRVRRRRRRGRLRRARRRRPQEDERATKRRSERRARRCRSRSTTCTRRPRASRASRTARRCCARARSTRGIGAPLALKAENLQRAGAFKFRGAYNAVAALRPDGVCSVSSGNHAQSLRWPRASTARGRPS